MTVEKKKILKSRADGLFTYKFKIIIYTLYVSTPFFFLIFIKFKPFGVFVPKSVLEFFLILGRKVVLKN